MKTFVKTSITAAVFALTSFAAVADHHGNKKDIVDTAIEAGNFTSLVTAVQAAGLVETLKGAGPFTVFAPTDEAFAAIPAADLEALLADKQALTRVLTYHVVAGKVLAADVVGLDSAVSVEGSSIRIEAGESGVTVDGANVIATDIITSNGVIHVIDAVILP
ncbi:MAG: beta-Ig-H3/fasciclin [Gammaproteobacteria bacterium HGW-Gammaproteobacteria-8]|nr:MAG: beta-Ig-H3/fasciclin [Gammaproteobacteria bacterium HGW-Gammaproteobacteria-8]